MDIDLLCPPVILANKQHLLVLLLLKMIRILELQIIIQNFYNCFKFHLFFDRSRKNPGLESSSPCHRVLNSNREVDHLQPWDVNTQAWEKVHELLTMHQLMRIQERESSQIVSPEYRKEKVHKFCHPNTGKRNVAPYTACSLPQSLQSNSHLGEREQTEGCSHNPDLIRRWVSRMAVLRQIWLHLDNLPSRLGFAILETLNIEVWGFLHISLIWGWAEYICVIWGHQDLGEDVLVWF